MQSSQDLFSTLKDNLDALLNLKNQLRDESSQNLQGPQYTQQAQSINGSENSDAEKQKYRDAILACFTAARNAAGDTRLSIQFNKQDLTELNRSEEPDAQTSMSSDNFSFVYIDDDNRLSVLQTQALESQKQAGQLISLDHAVSSKDADQKILLELIFDLDDREITQAALAHIEYVYQDSDYQNIPGEITRALEARQQDYLYYKALSDYFSNLLKYMVNCDARARNRGYGNLIVKLFNAIVADGVEQVADVLQDDSISNDGKRSFLDGDERQVSVQSVSSARSVFTDVTHISNFVESPEKRVWDGIQSTITTNQSIYRYWNDSLLSSSAPQNSDSEYSRLSQRFLRGKDSALDVSLSKSTDSDEAGHNEGFEDAISMLGDSVVSAGDVVNAVQRPKALDLNQRPSPHQRAITIAGEMLKNDDIYEPSCCLTLGSGKLVAELNKAKAKAEKAEKKYQKTTRSDTGKPKVLKDILRDAGAAGEQKQVALLAEQAFVKLFTHLRWRWLGYDLGGKRWEMQHLINQLRLGEISTEEFIDQLSPASQVQAGSAPSCFESASDFSGGLDTSVGRQENSQPKVYERLAKETGWRSMSLFRSASHSTTSIAKLNECLDSFRAQLNVKRV